jgi:hypothetical protein
MNGMATNSPSTFSDDNPELRTEEQLSPVAGEVAALVAVVRPILQGVLYALSAEAVRDAGGRENLLIRQLPRIYRQGDGDCGICFEYAVHDAILRKDSHVIGRVDDALKKHCKIRNGEASSILFGAEKNGAFQLIKTAKELLTDESRLLSGNAGQPCKLKRHLDSVASAFKRKGVMASLILPWSISGLWKADLFLGRSQSDQWVGATVKINRTQIQSARGLRVAVVPCSQGLSDAVVKDEIRNLVICPLPHDAAFMEVFYQGWNLVLQFLHADAKLPKEVYLPRPADRQVCRFLEERRGFPVSDVIEALGPLAQPGLLKNKIDRGAIAYERGEHGKTGSVIAPLPTLS